MNIKRGFLIIIIFSTVVFLASCKSQKEAAIAEMKQISSQIERLDDVIFDNIRLTQQLKMHESRLKAVKMKPKIYRIPLLIEGRSIYTSADELEIDEMSYSLAFEDLLEMHHPGKGKFKSDDPSAWKEIIIKHSKGALDHLSDVELPAIQRRVDEIEKENIAVGSKKRKLLEEYKTLQGKAMMLPEYHAALNIAAGRLMLGR
jgi:hypothetical protein